MGGGVGGVVSVSIVLHQHIATCKGRLAKLKALRKRQVKEKRDGWVGGCFVLAYCYLRGAARKAQRRCEYGRYVVEDTCSSTHPPTHPPTQIHTPIKSE